MVRRGGGSGGRGLSKIEALTRDWAFAFTGNAEANSWNAGDGNDFFRSSGGDDLFDGQFGNDRANYTHAIGAVDVQLASGIVTKHTNGVEPAVAGADTLRSIELVTGTMFADVYNAFGFSKDSANSGSTVNANVNGTFNEFEGLGGDDEIFGNGSTRVSYLHATAGVTVDLAAGTAHGDKSVGHDTFEPQPSGAPFNTGVSGVRGSYFNDFLYGSNSAGVERFDGRRRRRLDRGTRRL